MTAPLVSVLVRTCNDRPYVGRTLKAIAAQETDFDYEVLVCIDRSDDGTREEVAKFSSVRLVPRPEGDYRPAKTLNAMVATARGEIVVFNNADAVPLDSHWLSALVRPLRDGSVAAVYANQLPRPDATWLVKKDSFRAFGDGSVARTWRFFFSLASSAARRDDLLAHPFDPKMKYSEDVEWARRRPNFRIVYASDARVEHSHNYTFRELRRRFYGEGEADAVIFGDRPEPLARAVLGAVAESLRDFLFLLPRPTGWHEIFLAFPRRLTQRLAHRRGVAAGAD